MNEMLGESSGKPVLMKLFESPPTTAQFAKNGMWEKALSFDVDKPPSIDELRTYLAGGNELAFELFFGASFLGLRMTGTPAFVLEFFRHCLVCLDNASSAASFIKAVENHASCGDLCREVTHMEVGAVNAWKSVGPYMFPPPDRTWDIIDELWAEIGATRLGDDVDHPKALEVAYADPGPVPSGIRAGHMQGISNRFIGRSPLTRAPSRETWSLPRDGVSAGTGARFDLDEHPSQILADDSDGKCEEPVEGGAKGDQRSRVGGNLEGRRGNGGGAVQGKVPRATVVPLGVASMAGLPVVGDLHRGKADPGEETLHKTGALGQLFQGLHGPRRSEQPLPPLRGPGRPSWRPPFRSSGSGPGCECANRSGRGPQ